MIGWSWSDIQLHLEDEQRSGTGVFEEMRKLENTAFGVSPCEDCGELPCRCEWVQGPAEVVQNNLTQFFQATGLWVTKEAVCGRIPELEIHIKIQGR